MEKQCGKEKEAKENKMENWAMCVNWVWTGSPIGVTQEWDWQGTVDVYMHLKGLYVKRVSLFYIQMPILFV